LWGLFCGDWEKVPICVEFGVGGLLSSTVDEVVE
jgi:hypothetical protein